MFTRNSNFGVAIERLEIGIDKTLVAIELAQEAFQRTAVQSALRIPGVLQTKQERQDAMPIDLANLSRVFRGIAGDFDWLPQHCRIPPEKQRQHYERQRKPNRQPDQRAAEGFFGAASIAQRAQQERKKQAYRAVAEIECNTLERKYRRAPVRLDQGVQIIREEKADGDHGRAEQEGEYHAHHRRRNASPARAVRVTTASQTKFPAGEPRCTMRRATGETRKPSAPSPAQIRP